MMHNSGLGLVRCDWDPDTFQSYHGNGKWADDKYGLELWSGTSSAGLHYTDVDETQAAEIVDRIDLYIKNKASVSMEKKE